MGGVPGDELARSVPVREHGARASLAGSTAERSRLLGAHSEALGALLTYALLAVGLFGRDVVRAPAHTVVGDAGADKTIYMWAFVWWPHALRHGHDPFAATSVWSPRGVDLAWVTAVPGPSILLAPLTAAAGPVVTYNVLALAAPALAAFTAFVLARYLTHSVPAGLVAGFLFGFSSYMVGHTVGHLNLTLVFCVPIYFYLALRFVREELGRWTFVLGLAGLLVLQFLISTEIWLTLTLVGIGVVALSAVAVPASRQQLPRLVATGAAAYALAAIIVSPYIVHAVAIARDQGPPPRFPYLAAADALNYVVPTRLTWLRPPHSSALQQRFSSNAAEQGAYVGLPLLGVVAVAAWTLRRRRGVLLLAGAVAATALASLGPVVRVAGKPLGRGPWRAVHAVPYLNSALPIRLTVYVVLGCALLAALWLAERKPGQWWRWLVAGVACLAVLPNPSARLWAAPAEQSDFFRSGHYRHYIASGETVLVFPYGAAGWSMLWQAEAHMRFRMVGGHLGYHIIPAEREWYGVYRAFAGVRLPNAAAQVRRFLVAHHVAHVVIGPGTSPTLRRLIRAACPSRPLAIDDVLLYRPGQGRASRT